MKKTIVYGILNWGLGHATRSAKLIDDYQIEGYNVVIVSSGESLKWLKNEFPNAIFEESEDHEITYSSKNFNFHLLKQIPALRKQLRKEKLFVQQLIEKYQPEIIISDNRYGFRSNSVKSMIITHQLRFIGRTVQQPFLDFVSIQVQNLCNKFDEIWIPDYNDERKLSGSLTEIKSNSKVKFIGWLSRFEKFKISQTNLERKFITAIISGPEPMRTELLEKIIAFAIKSKKVIKIIYPKAVQTELPENVELINSPSSIEVYTILSQSKYIICRPGYSTLMDLQYTGGKFLFIPTKGQLEQEYLSEYLSTIGIGETILEENLTVEILEPIFIQ